MDPLMIAGFALKAMDAVSLAMKVGGDVMQVVNTTKNSLAAMRTEKRNPSDQEWEALNGRITALQAQLHGPE